MTQYSSVIPSGGASPLGRWTTSSIPFCTSSSSGLGESGELLAELAGTGDWQEGQRFRSSVAEADVVEWVNGLNLQ